MRNRIVVVLALALTTPWAARAASPAGSDAALAWLSFVDRGAYAESWAASGAIFHARISDAEWTQKIGPVRQGFGAVLARRLASEQPATVLPGAPDGHYDVVTFNTEFAAKHGAIETVVLAKEPAGWKVDGYLIK
jgi:hypothetical protein